MNLKMSAIVAIVTAAALTVISSTIPMAVYADESETDTDQENKQKNVGSGSSFNNNCAENTIGSDSTGGSSSDCTDNNQPSGSEGGAGVTSIEELQNLREELLCREFGIC